MITDSKEKIGGLLLKKGLLNINQLEKALLIQKAGDEAAGLERGEEIGKILLAKDYVDPMELVEALCEQRRKVDFLHIDKYLVEPRLISLIPESVAKKFMILPLVSCREKEVIIARTTPLSSSSSDALEKEIGKKVEVIIVQEESLFSIIKLCYKTYRRRIKSNLKIGEILVSEGYINQDELDSALRKSIHSQKMLGKILIEKGKLNETDFFKVLAFHKRVSIISADEITPLLDEEIIRSLPKAYCLHNFTLPYLRSNGKVFIVTSEPAIDHAALKAALKCSELDVKLITYFDIETIFRNIYKEKEVELEDIEDIEEAELEDIPIEEELAPVSMDELGTLTSRYQRITSKLLLLAIGKGASDIHIESYEKKVYVRYRIDGTLYDISDLKISKKSVDSIINVLKIWGNLNITERRLPQGGRFKKRLKSGDIYDFRLQTQPTLYGEDAIIRILSQSHALLGINELGLSPEMVMRYDKIIRNPSGLILITGPTGSGKTTTLYSTLDILRKDLRKKILTIEDPIEYSLERIEQCQVKEVIGYNFAKATRSFLREDPDIILIGEIRDYETAIEALKASQTGHLVFSTLHTNNTIETIQRFVDIGMDRSTIASELLLIISQRLAKRICPGCKKTHMPNRDLLNTLYPSGVPEGIEFYMGAGCEICDFRGHKGRVAIDEFWLIDTETKHLIISKAEPSSLFQNAVKSGMISMVKDALTKAESGIISLEEIPNVIPYSEILALEVEKSIIVSEQKEGG